MSLGGVVPPLVTPFRPDGSLDLAAFEGNLDVLKGTSLAGFLVLGSNGEAAGLEESEKLELIAAARRTVPGRFLLAGTGTESTRGTVALTRKAADLGADAALVLTPHFYRGRMSEEALRRHFTAVADASPIPIYLYSSTHLISQRLQGFRMTVPGDTPGDPRLPNIEDLHPYRGLWIKQAK